MTYPCCESGECPQHQDLRAWRNTPGYWTYDERRYAAEQRHQAQAFEMAA